MAKRYKVKVRQQQQRRPGTWGDSRARFTIGWAYDQLSVSDMPQGTSLEAFDFALNKAKSTDKGREDEYAKSNDPFFTAPHLKELARENVRDWLAAYSSD